jgi:hypothetical protein
LEDFAGVELVGIDETSLRRGQHYIWGHGVKGIRFKNLTIAFATRRFVSDYQKPDSTTGGRNRAIAISPILSIESIFDMRSL